jgi:hypothetical protein
MVFSGNASSQDEPSGEGNNGKGSHDDSIAEDDDGEGINDNSSEGTQDAPIETTYFAIAFPPHLLTVFHLGASTFWTL